MGRCERTHCQIGASNFCQHLCSFIGGRMWPNMQHCGNKTTRNANFQEILFQVLLIGQSLDSTETRFGLSTDQL